MHRHHELEVVGLAPELLTTPGATSDVHAAILDEVNAGWAKFGPQGKFRSAQVTVRIAPERVRAAFDDAMHVKVVMTEAPHGTAPALQGKNIANPMAMILAGAAILTYVDTPQAGKASRAIYESVFEAVHDGHATPDLAGRLSTTEFTDEVIKRVETKLEVWRGLRS